MRMWMVDPALMCRQHLLGEHRELHALVGLIRTGCSLAGYAEKELVETSSIQTRHEALVREMLGRGYNHWTPMEYVDTLNLGKVSREASQFALLRRCVECRKRNGVDQDEK